MRTRRLILTIVAVAVLLGGAGAVANLLIKTKPKPNMTPPEEQATPVRVLEVQPGDEAVVVPAMGTVGAAQSVELQPQVAGRVVEMSPQLRRGGRFSQGDLILRIDPRDYELMVDQQEAAVERARFDLAVEQGRQTVARREWELLEAEGGATQADQELALRKPHLRNAQASLQSAESGLARAQLDLERTTIRAPFNCFVTEESVDLGQVVGPQTRLAQLVGTDQFWVLVAVPVENLGWISLPSEEGTGGSPATVVHATGGEGVIERQGHVLCLCGDVDPVGRMARLLVAVDDPFAAGEGGLPLLLDAYVRVRIQGRTLHGVYAVPRSALRPGDSVWVMGEDNTLETRPVSVVWRRQDDVLVNAGLSPGERVVVSPIGTPLEGMLLKIANGGDEAVGEDEAVGDDDAVGGNEAEDPAP